jgi:hypothetical protein
MAAGVAAAGGTSAVVEGDNEADPGAPFDVPAFLRRQEG